MKKIITACLASCLLFTSVNAMENLDNVLMKDPSDMPQDDSSAPPPPVHELIPHKRSDPEINERLVDTSNVPESKNGPGTPPCTSEEEETPHPKIRWTSGASIYEITLALEKLERKRNGKKPGVTKLIKKNSLEKKAGDKKSREKTTRMKLVK